MKFALKVIRRFLVCLGISVAFFCVGGPVLAVFSIPVWGVAFAGPIMDFFETMKRNSEEQAYAGINGNHHEFVGR